MNMQLRHHNKSLNNNEPRRMFGKDITNICKGSIVNNLLKQHSLLKNQQEAPKHMEKHHHKDPILEYHVDIATFMQQLNPKVQGMMDEASAISDKMRQILVDWMVDVHQSFELREETLHLAFMYLEQFQNRNSIKKEQYQLIGITCLWIASKYEEIYPPRMKNYIQITAHTYSAVQLKDMEGKIIQSLNIELNRATPLSLIKLLDIESVSSQKVMNMLKYLMQICILNGKIMKKYNLNLILLAALKLSDKIFMQETSLGLITPIHQNQQFYTCYKEICLLLQLQNKYKLSAMKRKYTKEKFLGVGKIRIQN